MTDSFPKSERIVSQKLIDELFTSGQSHSLVAFPLRAVYKVIPVTQHPTPNTQHPAPNTQHPTPNTKHPTPNTQILISVPKKRFKHAVDRNRVKRQIREAYRHNKQPLCEAVPAGHCLLLAFVWISDEHVPSSKVNDSVKKQLSHIADRIVESDSPHLSV
jgi:ribonuclease P protein component